MIKIINIDKSPISLIGKNAAVCYGKPIEDGYSESDYKRGLACIESGHGRALEYAAVDVEVSGYSARCIREVYTHIIGTTRLQESTRYIDMSDFGYFTPKSIQNRAEAHLLYSELMMHIADVYERLRVLDIPVEDCANVIPLGSHSRITFKVNVRSLLHLGEERLCKRAYHEIRDFVSELREVLYLYGLDNDLEWGEIAQMMQSKCRWLGYCPEKKGCGMMISKKEAMRVLRDHNKPEILKKEFNLPEEKQHTCPICGKIIHPNLMICVDCFNKIMPAYTDTDDGIASKIDRV